MYKAGIRGNYHESSDCFNFEYPPKIPAYSSSYPKNTCQNFPTRKSPEIGNFKPKKSFDHHIRPVTWNPEYPPLHPEGTEVCISSRELHITILEPKTGYFAIVVCSLRIAIEWLNSNHYWQLFWQAGETLLRKDSSDHDHLRADSGFFFYNLYQGRLQASHR